MKVNYSSDHLKDIRSIYQLLESRNEGNIGIALGMLDNNKTYLQLAEKRYLKFIQARMNDPKADLSKFHNAMLSEEDEEDILFNIDIPELSISLSYLNDYKSKLIVDTIGGIVASCFDVNKYKKQVKRLRTRNALFNWAYREGKQLKKEMKTSQGIYDDGWYGKIQKKLVKADPYYVHLDHGTFDDANKSIVLEEFLFYLDAYSSDNVTFKMFQAYPPSFPEIFWMMSSVPEAHYDDTYFSGFPKSPMPFNQTAWYREDAHQPLKEYHSHKRNQ